MAHRAGRFQEFSVRFTCTSEPAGISRPGASVPSRAAFGSRADRSAGKRRSGGGVGVPPSVGSVFPPANEVQQWRDGPTPLTLRLTFLHSCSAIALATLATGFATDRVGLSAQKAVTDPVQIKGGGFEASGVAAVPNSRDVLFVDDGHSRQVFCLTFDDTGNQQGAAVPVPLDAHVVDPEDITTDGTFFYVVGSQSKADSELGAGLVRFIFDPVRRRVTRVEGVRRLADLLEGAVPELLASRRRSAGGALNIEGMVWDPTGARLLLGLRSPVVAGQALVLTLRLRDSTRPLTAANLAVVPGETMRLPLNGDGIRGLGRDPETGELLVLSGSPTVMAARDFRLLSWNGRAPAVLTPIATFPKRMQPEGVTRMKLAGRMRTLVVFDTGRYAVFP